MAYPNDPSFKPIVIMKCPADLDFDEFYTFNYVCEYNAKIFDILLSPNKPPGYDTENSIEHRILQRQQEACCSDCEPGDEEREELLTQEFNKFVNETQVEVIKASQSVMQDLAPESQDVASTTSLYSTMYPEMVTLQIVTKHGTLKSVRRDDLPSKDFHPPLTDARITALNLPHYEVSNIAKLYLGVFKVLVNSQVMVAKVSRGAGPNSLSDEICKLYEIQTTKFDSLVRVPPIKGLLISHMGFVGFLTDYIKSRTYSLEHDLKVENSQALVRS
jgi:hypothetical protein